MDQHEEARRLKVLFDGQPQQLVGFLSGQLSVVKSQAQMLMGLAGLTITVTGFSGHHMVRGGLLSTLAMVGGIFFVLIGVILTISAMAKLRWVTKDLQDDLVQTTYAVICRRDAEQRAIGRAGIFVASGVAFYLIAVVLAALHNGGAT